MTPLARAKRYGLPLYFRRGCPCGACGSLIPADLLPGWDDCVPADVRAVHLAAVERELALWDALAGRPEDAERAAAYRRLALASVRLIHACRALPAVWREAARHMRRDMLPAERAVVLCCPRTGPPLVPATGGRYVIPP